MLNIIISGVGGQGTVLASKLIAATALGKGLDIRTAETIGMAQRGGSVMSHVRIGTQIHSPFIPTGSAHIVIAFEPMEAVRVSPFLHEKGTMVVCDGLIAPVTASLSGNGGYMDDTLTYLKSNIKNLFILDGKQLAAKCGGTKTLNTALLGVAVQLGLFPFNYEDLAGMIRKNIHERFVDINLTALKLGSELCEVTRVQKGEQNERRSDQ